MNRLRLLVAWLAKAWPVFVVFAIALVHWAALAIWPSQSVLVHRILGTALQISGGLIVLHSINANLDLLRGKNMLGVAIAWAREFPFCSRRITLQPAPSRIEVTTYPPTVKVSRVTGSLEERIANLENDLDALKSEARGMLQTLEQKLRTTRIELVGEVSRNTAQVSSLARRMEGATIGGYKQQVFGVFLAIYGAVTTALV